MMIREMKKELKYEKRDKIKENEKVNKYEKDNISDRDEKPKKDSNCIFCGNKKGIFYLKGKYICSPCLLGLKEEHYNKND